MARSNQVARWSTGVGRRERLQLLAELERLDVLAEQRQAAQQAPPPQQLPSPAQVRLRILTELERQLQALPQQPTHIASQAPVAHQAPL